MSVKKSKSLFYVQSDFHYMICRSIMKLNHMDENDCYFICRRGVKVEKGLQLYPFPVENIYKRIQFYIWHRKLVNDFYKGCEITIYTPFRFGFPSQIYVKDVVFFEEGFNAYRFKKTSIEKWSVWKKIVWKTIVSFFEREVQGFIAGIYNISDSDPLMQTKMYICTPYAYRAWESPLIEKKLLKISVDSSEKYEIPFGSYFLVLERFNNSGSICSLESYKKCVKEMLIYCEKNHVHEIWTKFHPADWQNEAAMQHLEDCKKGINIKIKFFDGHLEYLALQNIGITFIATSSTILYYAPLLGKSNRSVSFVRYLERNDEKYKSFIQYFGGIEQFVKIFSENVECLNIPL